MYELKVIREGETEPRYWVPIQDNVTIFITKQNEFILKSAENSVNLQIFQEPILIEAPPLPPLPTQETVSIVASDSDSDSDSHTAEQELIEKTILNLSIKPIKKPLSKEDILTILSKDAEENNTQADICQAKDCDGELKCRTKILQGPLYCKNHLKHYAMDKAKITGQKICSRYSTAGCLIFVEADDKKSQCQNCRNVAKEYRRSQHKNASSDDDTPKFKPKINSKTSFGLKIFFNRFDESIVNSYYAEADLKMRKTIDDMYDDIAKNPNITKTLLMKKFKLNRGQADKFLRIKTK